MKKIFLTKVAAMTLAGTMILSLAACGSADSSQTQAETSTKQEVSEEDSTKQEGTDISAGGWETNIGALSIESNEKAKAAFEKAVEGLTGYEYEAIALLGTQAVAGTNYSILARGTAVVPDAQPTYEIINVYEDLEGNAEVTGSKILVGGNEEGFVGGYEVNSGEYDITKNADVKEALDKALEGFVGADYDAIAYLGSQAVSGINYLTLMRITPAVPNAQAEIALVTVYDDLEGNAEVSETETISIDSDEEVSDSGNVQIPDPFEEFERMEEAADAAGFELRVPEAPNGYQNAVYRVNKEYQMIEVIFSDKPLEDDGTEGYRIRKADGNDDISGDYNDYNETKTVSVDSNTVTLKGNDGKVFVATWTSGDYTYAIDIDMGGQGMSADEVIAIAEATK